MTAVGADKNIQAMLREARTQLGNNFSAALDARLLLQEATGLTHAEIIAAPETEISAGAVGRFNAFIARRMAHEPVSRILGRREFYGRNFIVTPDVLDPRPDTEVVVELALKLVPRGRFIDLGTGSGAIAITLTAENQNLSGIASDVSPTALAVAQINAKANAVEQRLAFQLSHWFEGVAGKFDLIIANPPYIRANAKLVPEVFEHDPHLALFGGEDGLQAYHAISGAASSHLATNGIVVLEVGAGQHEEVAKLFETKGLILLEAASDLQDHVRALAFSRS
jgi:release factor glutamine methyltransferase